MERIVNDGKSILLSQLADRVGNIRTSRTEQGDSIQSTPQSVNLVEMTVVNRPVVNQPVPVESIKKEAVMEEKGQYKHVMELKDAEDMVVVDDETEALHVCDNTGNDSDITEWSVSVSVGLKELIVGNNCLQHVRELKLSGFEELEKVEVGTKCFSGGKNGCFEVSGCEKLKSVKIGNESCEDWTAFTLKHCGVEEVSIGDGCFVSCENTVFESECCCMK